MRTLTAVLVMLCATARAGDGPAPRTYTLDECLKIGLERSATAANARRDQEIAGARAVQARSEALPHFSANANYTRMDEVQSVDLGGQSIDLSVLDNYSAKAEVSQLLYSGGRVGAAIKAASLVEQHAAWTRMETEARLARDIRAGFHDLLLAKKAVKVREASLAQIESLLAQTERKQKTGAASEFEVLTARVRTANEKPELIKAKNIHDVAMEGFKRLLGADDPSFDIQGELACEPLNEELETVCRRALQSRPAVQAMDVWTQLNEQDFAAAKSGYQPSVNAFFSYNAANPYGGLAVPGNEWQLHWNAGLALTWALWDGGLTRGLVDQKRLEWDKSRTDLEDFKKAVKLEVTQAYLDMKRALETIEAGKGTVALAEKAMAVAKTRYDTGMATYLEYTDANLALRTAELALYNALHDHMNAVARLKYAAGMEDRALNKEKKP